MRKNYYRRILHIYKGEVPWNYFVIAIPGSKAVRMLLNNVSYTVKSMLRICGVVSYLCKTPTKVLHLSQSKNNYKSYFFKEQMNRSILQWRNPSKWDYIFWTNNEIINLKEKRETKKEMRMWGVQKKNKFFGVEDLRAPRDLSSSSFSTDSMLWANLRVRLIISNASQYLCKEASDLHNYKQRNEEVRVVIRYTKEQGMKHD